MATVHFTDDSFESEVLQSNIPVLVDFFAEWCGPCKQLAPIIEELASEYTGRVKIGKLNVDESPNTAAKYGIMSIPTLLFVKGGEEVTKISGFQSKDVLEEKLNALL